MKGELRITRGSPPSLVISPYLRLQREAEDEVGFL